MAITAALGVLFVVGSAGAIVWSVLRRQPTHRPGEEVEGLSAELARSLPDDYPRVTFTDVSAEAGIRFRHFFGDRSSQLPEDMGSGAAWGDYDNDGWLDLFVVNETGPLTLSDDETASSPAHSVLYHNHGDGSFTEVSAAAGVDFRGLGMAAAWGDYDNDGWPDLFVSAYGNNVLYRNDGDGTFTDVTRESGLGGRAGFWAGASWGDYDRDGFLDLYVAGYVRFSPGPTGQASLQYDVEVPASINPSAFEPERNLLFHNNADGTFTEVADRVGVGGRRGRSLAAVWSDLNEDGWPDLYVANDVSDNALFRNLGNGYFEDVSHAALVADYRGAMGLAVGDWDGDLDRDIFVTHWIAQENALFNSLLSRFSGLDNPPVSGLRFMDEADRYGLGQIALDFIGWGTSFIDYDNDGRLDLFVVNGSTFQDPARPQLLIPMPDQLFWNRGPTEGFYDVSSVSGPYFGQEYVGRGAAFGDYDNDGDVDVFVVNNGGPGVLLRNDGGNRNAWLKVLLHGTRSNRSALGAKLRLVAGGRAQIREVGAQSSYLSQNSPIEHFGLGSLREVDTLAIAWPSGSKQLLIALAANQTVLVAEERERADGVPAGAHRSATTDARERVHRFWELYRQATRHRVAGETRAAAANYARALELNETHQDALYYLGNMYFELGEFAKAEQSWLRLVEVDPNSSRGHSQLGVLYSCFEEERYADIERAEAEFRRALEINREETGPLLHLGQLAAIRGDLSSAREQLDAVTRSNFRSVTAHYLKGYLAWKEDRLGEAEQLFATAVRYAQPAPPLHGVRGEGDTRSGFRPLLSQRTSCRSIEEQAERLSGVRPDELLPRMDESYRELDALLARVRERLEKR
ncbi:MAG: FG-GAP-like repeat-containing protein [Gemmatimonadota bacterium]